MKLLSTKNSSVLFSLIGVMCIMLGFNGFMAHTFSMSTEEIGGVKLVKAKNLSKELAENPKVCIVSPIYSDDTVEMPDNHQPVIKGKLYISALWPDGSKNVIVNWSKQSSYIRLPESDSSRGEVIMPKNIECAPDTSLASTHLKITRGANSVSVEYFQYKCTLNGCYTKGQPEIVFQREYLMNGDNVAITMSQKAPGQKPEISNVIHYKTALEREKGVSRSKTIYLIIGVLGILMLFVPEEKAINTISNIKMIGNKILSK